jgi:hypothetical protein
LCVEGSEKKNFSLVRTKRKAKRKVFSGEGGKKFKRKFSPLLSHQKRIIKVENEVKEHRESMEDEGNGFWASD